MNWANLQSTILQVGELSLAVIVTWVAVFKALSAFLGFFGAWWPPALRAAAWCSTVATYAHMLAVGLGNLLPGTEGARLRKERATLIKAPAPDHDRTLVSPRSGQRGFLEVRVLPVLCAITFLVVAGFACGILPAVAPTATLIECVGGVVQSMPAADLVDIVRQSLVTCGADAGVDVLAILDAIIASKDPNMDQYKAEAMAVRNDPTKLAALRSKVGHK